MRGGFRRRAHEEEEESAFVSMTDMTVSFLFIVMLLLAYFASQYSSETVPLPVHTTVVAERDAAVAEIKKLKELLARTQSELTTSKNEIVALEVKVKALEDRLEKLKVADPLESYLAMSANQRVRILESLKRQLSVDFPDLQVVISQETDALRFQGDGLFKSGASDLRSDRKPIVETIASRLQEILPCYTLGPDSRWTSDCNPGGAIIEAVQIEGHTDAVGGDISNLMLSTARANTTFIVMTAKEPRLVNHQNYRKQPVLSVAGYGKMRPVADNDTAEGKATNRRIDLRIIMYTPSRSEEIARIRDALNQGISNGERR